MAPRIGDTASAVRPGMLQKEYFNLTNEMQGLKPILGWVTSRTFMEYEFKAAVRVIETKLRKIHFNRCTLYLASPKDFRARAVMWYPAGYYTKTIGRSIR